MFVNDDVHVYEQLWWSMKFVLVVACNTNETAVCFISVKTYKFLDILHCLMHCVEYKQHTTPSLNLETKRASDG
jgi:hypothetical protein